jgi:hypothetical protein
LDFGDHQNFGLVVESGPDKIKGYYDNSLLSKGFDPKPTNFCVIILFIYNYLVNSKEILYYIIP